MLIVSVLLICDILTADKKWKRALVIVFAPLTTISIVLILILVIFIQAIFKEE